MTSVENNLSLAQWLAKLEQLHPTDIELGLERVGRVAKSLGLINLNTKVVTVAGTNGKGSTCAILESILSQAGYSVGVYSSPHLVRYEERVRVRGKELPAQAHCQAFSTVDSARGETSLTYFEFGTLAGVQLLKDANLDVILLEVGLGGRLDATNVIEPDISVVTTIDIDHIDWLGDNREDVGFEKAGIFRSKKPAICGDFTPPQRLIDHANNIGAELSLANQAFSLQEGDNNWQWQGEQTLTGLPKPTLPLQNASTALAVIEKLGLAVSPEQIKAGLAQAKLAGRLQQVSSNPLVYLDVAHNPQSAAYLAERLTKIGKGKRILAVVGMLKDKDIAGTLDKLKPLVDSWYLASLQGPRAASASELIPYLGEQRVQGSYQDVWQGYQQALADSGEAEMVIVFGSFYTVSQIIERTE